MIVFGPTIMLHCSGFHLVAEAKLGSVVQDLDGIDVVCSVSWSEKHGAKERSFSERWRLVAPNIWQAMSLKK